MGIPHLTLNFGSCDKGRNRVNDNDVNGTAVHQRLGNLKRLFAAVGLCD